jgi:lipopolysaccharide/colanic/teichoic acid biosynthesis glycosyltransferase
MNIKIQLFFKKVLDFSVAFILLLFLWPLLLLISIFLLTFEGKPVMFRQLRPGLNEKIFEIFKFRTMHVFQANMELSDHERMSALGRFIRKTSLDELPQLYNVLRGDLSLVGPRPLLVEYLPLYNTKQKKRHLVKPGITGWAQVNGRNAISWEQKFEYDVWYVENWSLLLDLKIIFLTFFKILKPSGVNASDSVTMEKFKGTK